MAHRTFRIPEILEIILLGLDTKTLLLSTRVCRTWNALIRSSPGIQKALFFRPADPRLFSRLVGAAYFSAFPLIASEEIDKAYLRPEASWRRMLLQQPPTSFVYDWNIAKVYLPRDSTLDPGGIDCTPDGDFVRLQHVAAYIHSDFLFPGVYPSIFWADDPAVPSVRRTVEVRNTGFFLWHYQEQDFIVITQRMFWARHPSVILPPLNRVALRSPGVWKRNPCSEKKFDLLRWRCARRFRPCEASWRRESVASWRRESVASWRRGAAQFVWGTAPLGAAPAPRRVCTRLAGPAGAGGAAGGRAGGGGPPVGPPGQRGVRPGGGGGPGAGAMGDLLRRREYFL
ncbi:hypothetical protein BO82DRAFT_404201 [Aspergillus uvarum CBS 121591]|uniref:F-box domain-containing protein n=1 Tax=Aspergillus uvarum CBS 121591 TaxID=1448315 RepID=A0A319C364_9EURO|nr:hypothetical protein BO82DRAFT_404201 [Aspergillus uvarum CBS 121591]PYH79564.1 hypothetical protein BO82DRAFT_404201 [Aspergillus uvarum CBS 121591]